jgi:hypothetical protein
MKQILLATKRYELGKKNKEYKNRTLSLWDWLKSVNRLTTEGTGKNKRNVWDE